MAETTEAYDCTSPVGEDLQVPVTKDQVKDGPRVDDDQALSEAEERQLFSHYQVPTTTAGSTTATGAPGSGQSGYADSAVSAGGGHDTSGPITDENLDRAMSGADISEEEHEVVLHAEEPVVEKRVVPQERVRLDTERFQDEREISEEIRKEQTEIDDSARR